MVLRNLSLIPVIPMKHSIQGTIQKIRQEDTHKELAKCCIHFLALVGNIFGTFLQNQADG